MDTNGKTSKKGVKKFNRFDWSFESSSSIKWIGSPVFLVNSAKQGSKNIKNGKKSGNKKQSAWVFLFQLDKRLILIEMIAQKHLFAQYLSKFHLKSHLSIDKSCNNWRFWVSLQRIVETCHLCTTYWNNEALCSTFEWKCEILLLDAGHW